MKQEARNKRHKVVTHHASHITMPQVNLRGGLALIRKTWLSWVQHRSFFFLLAFGWMIPPLIYLFVWSTAASGGKVGGFSRGEFVAYYLILILVNQLTYSQTNWTVGDVIRYGGMNSLLLRPLSPVFDALSSEVAGKVVYMLFIIPVTAVLALLLRPELDLTLQSSLAFFPALVLAWALRFFWGYWLALLAFWATRADALMGLQDALIFLLAGQVAPTTLLPEILQQIATWLPFRYMVGFPVEILTGQLDTAGILTGFAFQIGWLAAAMALFVTMWKTGIKRYSAVGG
ncbi:MAG: ABC-2 family transporter protein [Anaerolineae bacterium]|nr:ABC-2 family transporter protein [Anaerolineae bacterium]